MKKEPMKPESSAAGFALILGAFLGIVTMALHPTGHDLLAPGSRGARMTDLAVVVHAIALAGIPVSVFGFFGLTRLLDRAGSIPLAAFIVYSLGSVAVLCAAVASGLIAPGLARQIAEAEPSAQQSLQPFLHYTSAINQAFAAVFVVASSTAVILWSAAIVQSGILSRAVGLAGCVIGAASLALFLSGHLRLNVHGFGAFLLAQAAWTVAVGLQMLRSSDQPGPA